MVMKATRIESLDELNGQEEDWLSELKLDGERVEATFDHRGTTLINAAGNDITAQYPELTVKEPNGSLVIDGEIVIGAGKKADFNKLQGRTTLQNKRRIAHLSTISPVNFVAFDILSVNKRDMRGKRLEDRQEVISAEMMTHHIFENKRYKVMLPIALADLPEIVLVTLQEKGFEGIMLKHRDSQYEQNRRSTRWLKYKFMLDVDCVAIGYTEGTGWRDDNALFGALILGVYEKGKIIEVGKVGTGRGLTQQRIRELKAMMVETGESERRGKDQIHWVEPNMVVAVKCLDITKDGRLRQPTLRAIRDDKLPQECVFA